MTLDEMIQETAIYIDEDIGASPYTGGTLKIVNKLISGLNYAYIKICRERWKPSYTESVVLDSSKQFDISDLTNTFNSVKWIKDSDGFNVFWKFIDDSLIECSNNSSGDLITMSYFYIPAELSGSLLTGTTVFPAGTVENKILCFYAAYQYLTIDDDEKATYWLNLFNDGFDNISQNRGEVKRVKNRMWL